MNFIRKRSFVNQYKRAKILYQNNSIENTIEPKQIF